MNLPEYKGIRARSCKEAKAAAVFGWIGLAGWLLSFFAVQFLFLIIAAPIAVVLAIIALIRLNWRGSRLTGKGYALTGMALGTLGFVLFPLLLSNLSRPTDRHWAGAGCAANLSGIGKAMQLYAAENHDAYPLVEFAPYSAGLNDPKGVPISPSTDTTIQRYYAGEQAGSPTASEWLLVLKGTLSVKSFICKSDPWSPGAAPLKLGDDFYNNFTPTQGRGAVSYSFAYPWTKDGKPAAMWKNSIDASLPLGSDMAPLQGTGTPAVDVRGSGKVANSRNHYGGEGQNVVWGDAHVSFEKTSYIGQGGDNIFTFRKTADATSVAGTPPTITATPGVEGGTAGTFDTVMMPVRNETTGGL